MIFSHPATEYTCRHCRGNAGHDPEMCYRCGPLCGKCFVSENPLDCPAERKKQDEIDQVDKRADELTAGGK